MNDVSEGGDFIEDSVWGLNFRGESRVGKREAHGEKVVGTLPKK